MIAHRLTGFLDFFHRPVFSKVETGFVSMFPSSVEGRREKTSTQLGPLERPNLNHWIC
jgi:hypothetical protein